MRRVLTLCLLAYPRATRERDGGYLRDLAVEMAVSTGGRRQALSLLRGGLTERLRSRRRFAVVVGSGAAVLLLGIPAAVAATGDARVEAQACVGSADDCAGLATWAAEQERQGWECERATVAGEVAWQCVAP